jgi:glycosyltransferase 2 family protein
MWRIVRIVVTLGLLALVVFLVDWRMVWGVLRAVDLEWVALALLLAILDRVIINYRWQVLLAGRGVEIRFWRLFRVQLAANFAGSFLPSSIGVDALRAAALCRSGAGMAPVVAATLVDRLSLVLASLVFGSVMVIVLAHARVPPDVVSFVFAMTALGILACAACLHAPVRRFVRLQVLRRIPHRFRDTVGSIAQASAAYRTQWRALLKVSAATLVLFLVRLLFAKSLALSCGVDPPFLDLLLVIPILWILVMLPITIGGFGVQEASYVLLMSLIGIGPAVAVSMSLLEHLVARLASLPGALFVGDFVGARPTPARDA